MTSMDAIAPILTPSLEHHIRFIYAIGFKRECLQQTPLALAINER